MRRQMLLSGIVLVVLALLVAACGPTPESGDAETGNGFTKNADGYADITVEQLAGMMPDKDFALVNVHIPYQGEIPETDLYPL